MPATDNGRIVITGLGAVTPVGNDVDTFWRRMKAGDSGAGPITAFDTDGFKVKIACEVRDFEAREWLEGKAARRLARATHFAVASAKQAVADAELAIEPATAHRCGITFNTGGGGLASMETGTRRLVARGPQQANPFLVTDVMPNAVSCLISIELGLTGPTTTSTLACASGNYALLEAYRLLRSGEVDAVIAGGTEAGITPLIIATFSRLQALSTRNDDPKAASRPFDADRDGFVFGEGGVAFVVETERHAEQRGARVYAEVRGGAVTADAHHLTAPRPDGSGAAAAMSRALESSRTDPARSTPSSPTAPPRRSATWRRRWRSRRHSPTGPRKSRSPPPNRKSGTCSERPERCPPWRRSRRSRKGRSRRRSTWTGRTRTATWTTFRTGPGPTPPAWRSSTPSASAARTW